MSVWITSDLHLGHAKTAERRGFSSVQEHDDAVLHNLSFLTKRDKLFILGDVARKKEGLSALSEIQCTKDAVLGNHDLLPASEYAKVFNKVYGIVKYKNYWLSHCPIHPQEMYHCIGNVHGHIHNGADKENLGPPYLNVCLDFWDMKPIPFDYINEKLKKLDI